MNAIDRFSLPPPSPRSLSADIRDLCKPLPEDRVEKFGEMIQQDLTELEERFALFTTKRSFVVSLQRSKR